MTRMLLFKEKKIDRHACRPPILLYLDARVPGTRSTAVIKITATFAETLRPVY
jgi:hypothetical protein